MHDSNFKESLIRFTILRLQEDVRFNSGTDNALEFILHEKFWVI